MAGFFVFTILIHLTYNVRAGMLRALIETKTESGYDPCL